MIMTPTKDELHLMLDGFADDTYNTLEDWQRHFIVEFACRVLQNFRKPDVSGCKELLLQMIEREHKYIDKCRSEGKGHEHSKGIIKGLEMAINVEDNYHRLIAI